jgi:hypothetical protein
MCVLPGLTTEGAQHTITRPSYQSFPLKPRLYHLLMNNHECKAKREEEVDNGMHVNSRKRKSVMVQDF